MRSFCTFAQWWCGPSAAWCVFWFLYMAYQGNQTMWVHAAFLPVNVVSWLSVTDSKKAWPA